MNGSFPRSLTKGLAACLLLLAFAPTVSAARISAEARLPGQDDSPITIEPGMALHTGDAVRFKLGTETDAYVYLIVIGSSGTARVLQPFSGKPADAWMGAGEERQIPPGGKFLPLDQQAGSETVLALSVSAPITNLARLLVRLEAAAPDSVAMREVLSETGLDAGMLAFRHLNPQAVAVRQTPAPTPAKLNTAAPVGSAAASGDDSAGVVLGGLGSRISAFQSDQAIPPQPGTAPAAQAVELKPSQTGSSQISAVATEEPPAQETGVGASIASWFGFGSEQSPTQTDAKKTATVPADTFPLQARESVPAPRVLPQPQAPVQPGKPAGQAGQQSTTVQTQQDGHEPALATATTGNPKVILVEPLAVEKTLQDSDRAASSAQIEEAPNTASVEPEIQPDGKAAGILASLFGPASGPASDSEDGQPPPRAKEAAPLPLLLGFPATQSNPQPATTSEASLTKEVQTGPQPGEQPPAEPQSIEPSTPDAGGGGLLGWLTGTNDKQAEEPADGTDSEDSTTSDNPPQAPQAAPESPAVVAAESAAPAAESVAEQSAGETTAAALEPATAPVESSGGGLLDWLTGTNDKQAEESADGADSEDSATSDNPPQAPQVAPESPAVVAAESAVPAAESVAEQPTGKTTAAALEPTTAPVESSGGGLLDWLTGTNDKQAEESADGADSENSATSDNPPQAPQAAPESPAVVAAESAAPAAESVAEQPTGETTAAALEPATAPAESSGGGLLDWLTGSNDKQAEESADGADSENSATSDNPSAAPGAVGALSSPDEQTPDQEAQPQSPGLLAGLGALFGASSEADTTATKPAATEQLPPKQTPAPVESEPAQPESPAMTRTRNAQGESVVVLSGPQVPPTQTPEAGGTGDNHQVLSGQGSRIQALLEPQNDSSNAGEQPATAQTVQAEDDHNTPQSGSIASQEQSQPAVSATAISGAAGREASSNTISKDEPPLALNPEVSQQNVTQLALSSGPAQALQQAVENTNSVDLSDDQGLASAVVLVISAYGRGAGVVINTAGQVLTNWHLVRDLDRVAVAFKQPGEAQIADSRLFRAQVLRLGKYPDLALLAVEGGVPASVARLVGAKNAAAGAARGRRLHTLHLAQHGAWQAAVATVERVRSGSSWYSQRRILHRGTVIRANLTNHPGISGAPLFNELGEITGLTTLVKPGKNQLIAVSAQTLRRFLQQSE